MRRTVLALAALVLAGCTGGPAAETEPTRQAPPQAGEPTDAPGPLTVYSGRSEELVGPILDRFGRMTGIEVAVRYGDSAELAATILEEGANSPADVYFAQDAGALGALRAAGMLAPLPADLLARVDERFRAPDDTWVGVSGRARTLVYNTDVLSEDAVPDSVLGLTDERWRGSVGWAPTNGSFQAFVTAMRIELGGDVARTWLEGMIANGVRAYERNTAIVEATGRGEIEIGLVNHYYLYQFLTEDPGFPAANKFLAGGDVGALVNVAGLAVLRTAARPDAAGELLRFLLSPEAQEYFSAETFEYPLATGVPADPRLPPLEFIQTPELDLSSLEDLAGTLGLLREVGALN